MIRIHVCTDRIKENRPAIVVLMEGQPGPPYVCQGVRGPGFTVKQALKGEPRPDGCPHVWLEIDGDGTITLEQPELFQ